MPVTKPRSAAAAGAARAVSAAAGGSRSNARTQLSVNSAGPPSDSINRRRPVSPRTPTPSHSSQVLSTPSTSASPRQRRHSASERSPTSASASNTPSQPTSSSSSRPPSRPPPSAEKGRRPSVTRGRSGWTSSGQSPRQPAQGRRRRSILEMSADGAPPSDGELDLLLDALMPRLIARMQAAYDRVKWGTAAASTAPSLSPSSTSSSSFSPSASSGLTEEHVEQLVRTGVADGLQQLLTSLYRTAHRGGERGEEEDEDESLVSGLSDTQSIVDEPPERIVTPSMRLLGDVSLQPRSVVAVNQPLMKVWSVQNSGSTRWPEQLRLLPVGGAASPFVLESDVLLFTDLAVGEQLKLSVPITTPSQAGRYVATYRLAFYQAADSQWVPFGDPLLIDLTCKDTSTSAAAADSTALSSAASASAESAQVGGASAGQQGAGVDGERKGSVEEKPQRKPSREQKEAAIVKRIVDTAVESTLHPPSHLSDSTPSPYTDGEPRDPGDGQATEGKKERRERLRVEKTKDRSASVDSKPPSLNVEWFSFVPSDATSRPSSGPSPQPQQPPAGTGEAQNLLSSSPRSSPASNDQELDWLNDAKKGEMKVAVVAASPAATAQAASGSSGAPSGLRPLALPLHTISSKSASHSRSNSPALPPQAFPPQTSAAFARSTSQQFPPTQGMQGMDLMSPPLTPTVPSHSTPAVKTSMISKDDLMSWAGGTGLSVTNKQTGVQSQHAPSPSPPPQLTNGGGAAANAGAGGGAGGGPQTTLPRHLSNSPRGRSRHSLPPAAAGGGGSAGGRGTGSTGSTGSTYNGTMGMGLPSSNLPSSNSSQSLAGQQTSSTAGTKSIPSFQEQAAWMNK